jgi:hypothetical protein
MTWGLAQVSSPHSLAEGIDFNRGGVCPPLAHFGGRQIQQRLGAVRLDFLRIVQWSLLAETNE